jgi:DNA repair protein RadA/Sms
LKETGFCLYRILRAIKNRFGPVDEVGHISDAGKGAYSVENPSSSLSLNGVSMPQAAALFPYITGSRPIILEVQAVTQDKFLHAKRIALGYDITGSS